MSFAANPKAPKGDTVDESVGAVASDSLAAESINTGGAFAENSNAAVSSVKGAQSTLNNDNTTDAHVLHAASNREERDIGANVSSTQYPAQAGTPGFTGTASQEGYAGGPTSTSASSTGPTSTNTGSHVYSHSSSDNAGTTSAVGANAGIGARPYVPSAPTAAYSSDAHNTQNQKPKGTNLHENEDIAPGKITFTGDVGGEKDPGRLAEQKFLNSNAAAGGDAGLEKGLKGGEDDGGNIYDQLKSSERA